MKNKEEFTQMKYINDIIVLSCYLMNNEIAVLF